AVMLAGAPYTVLKGAVYIHPTLAEGFWTLMEEVKPVEEPPAKGNAGEGEPHVKLISVNVGLPREGAGKGKPPTPAICKEPIQGRVVLRMLNRALTIMANVLRVGEYLLEWLRCEETRP